MSGLVGYGSSDEEDSEKDLAKEDAKISTTTHPREQLDNVKVNGSSASAQPLQRSLVQSFKSAETSKETVIQGPSLGPSVGPSAGDENGSISAPASPYSAYRSSIQSLTLPTIPNMEIPPSPSASPPPEVDAKVNQFLALKKRGVHFNAKLAASSALKNPSLLPKLMDSVGLVKESDQYATTLPRDLWSHDEFPSWAYKEELAKAQQRVGKEMEAERRGREREFVSAATKESSLTVSSGKNKPSAAERVMAGLERRGGSREPERDHKRRRRSRSR